MLKYCFFFSVIMAVSPQLNAQKYSNEFLSIGVGARAQAMGGAQLALVGDATAGFLTLVLMATLSFN